MTGPFVEIGFVIEGDDGEEVRHCLTITPELAGAIRAAGMDPALFNVMRWPNGAGRHASGWFLATRESILSIMESEPTSGSGWKFRIGDIDFDRLYIISPRPLVTGVTTELWAFQMVDERAYWQSRSLDAPDSNLRADDKGDVYAATGPRTLAEIIDALSPSGSGETTFVDWGEVDTLLLPFLSTDTEPGLADLRSQGMSFGEAIDRACALAGVVFIARTAPVGGLRYAFKRVDQGWTQAKSQLFEPRAPDLIAGGLESQGLPGDLYSLGFLENLATIMPAAVAVHFPTYRADAQYRYNDTAGAVFPPPQWTLGQATVVTVPFVDVSAAFPGWWPVPTGQGVATTMVSSVWDSKWAEFDDSGAFVDPTGLADRAKVAARLFYSRFIAGCGDATFRTIFDFEPWAGALWREWGVMETPEGPIPYTRVQGARNDRPFGWCDETRPLMQNHVVGTGLARVIPRPDGGIQIDVPAQESQRKELAIESSEAIAGESFQWRYTMIDPDDPGTEHRAYNRREKTNTATHANDVIVANLPSGFTILPIGKFIDGTQHQVPVECVRAGSEDGIPVWHFWARNQIDGVCS